MFQANNNQMLDPNEIFNDGTLIETEATMMHSQIGLSREQFVERLNARQYAMINHGGETILLYRIDDNRYILIDTHVTTGFMLITDINNWLDVLYNRYVEDIPMMTWFAPAP